MLKSRTSFPPLPGNWKFYQAELNWYSTPYIGFDPTVEEIIKVRLANPRFNLPTDRVSVERELEDQTEAKLRQLPGIDISEWVVSGSPPVPTMPRPHPRRAAGPNLVVGVNKVVAGVGLLVSWLGDGLKPVEQGLANQRAETCTKCPLNKKPTVLQSAYGSVANGLHLLMEAKADMKLTTPFDEQLETCAACDCRNSLKIWTPIAHEKKYTTPQIMAALDANCWIRKELST